MAKGWSGPHGPRVSISSAHLMSGTLNTQGTQCPWLSVSYLPTSGTWGRAGTDEDHV